MEEKFKTRKKEKKTGQILKQNLKKKV